VILIDLYCDLVILIVEIEFETLLLVSHLCLYHLTDLFDVVINRLFDVYYGRLYPLNEPFDPDHALDPPCKPQVAPPSLQAGGCSML
jgi:hypothetical protein